MLLLFTRHFPPSFTIILFCVTQSLQSFEGFFREICFWRRLRWVAHGPNITSRRSLVVIGGDTRQPRVSSHQCDRLIVVPDDFIFYGTKTQRYDAVGQAVCPPITKHITEAMIKHIEF